MKISTQQDGITLLITLLVMGVLLGVSASLLNVTLKQFQLSGIAYASEIAFQAANAGMECALWHDYKVDASHADSNPVLNPFAVPDDPTLTQSTRPTIECMGLAAVPADVSYSDGDDGLMKSGQQQRFKFTWDVFGSDLSICSDVSVYKFASTTQVTVNGERMRGNNDVNNACPQGSVCTVIQSRGYNVECAEVGNQSRVVEREYTQVY